MTSNIWINSYSTWDGVREYELALDLVARGRVQGAPLVTHRVGLDQIAAGFAWAADKAASGATKVMVIPWPGAPSPRGPVSWRPHAVPYPNVPDKHTAAPLVTPQRALDYARASGRLVDFSPPRGVLMVYRRSLMARLIDRYGAPGRGPRPGSTSRPRPC